MVITHDGQKCRTRNLDSWDYWNYMDFFWGGPWRLLDEAIYHPGYSLYLMTWFEWITESIRIISQRAPPVATVLASVPPTHRNNILEGWRIAAWASRRSTNLDPSDTSWHHPCASHGRSFVRFSWVPSWHGFWDALSFQDSFKEVKQPRFASDSHWTKYGQDISTYLNLVTPPISAHLLQALVHLQAYKTV